MVLNEGRIKAMTGRNAIAARFLHQEWFVFVPEFKLLLETNHRPQIKGTDTAIWNRVKIVGFENVVAKEDQDPHFADRLRAELPGILNWAIRGCLAWQQGGLREPEAIRAATDEYREASDLIGEFLGEACDRDDEARTRSSEIYGHYRTFAESRGRHPISDQRFADAMRERGFTKKAIKGYPNWAGIRLLPSPPIYAIGPKSPFQKVRGE